MENNNTMKFYEKKIERILSNKLEYNGDNQKAIEEVKIWLCCEWQGSDMSMEDYGVLKERIKSIADRMIQEF